MWRVTWISTLLNNSALVLLHDRRVEYKSAFVGNGLRRHLADEDKRTLCRIERRKTGDLPVAYDPQRGQVDCQRCLGELQGYDKAPWVKDYQEE